jgi:hypothetical protein
MYVRKALFWCRPILTSKRVPPVQASRFQLKKPKLGIVARLDSIKHRGRVTGASGIHSSLFQVFLLRTTEPFSLPSISLPAPMEEWKSGQVLSFLATSLIDS